MKFRNMIIIGIMSLVLTVSSFADGVGVAIIANNNTSEQKPGHYSSIIANANELFIDAFIPTVIVDTSDVDNDILDFFEVAVLLSDSNLETTTIEKLKDFLQKGGKIAATYDTSLQNLLGVVPTTSLEQSFDQPLSIVAEKNLTAKKPLLVKGDPLYSVTKWSDSDFAAVIKSNNTLYVAEELFTSSEASQFDEYFIDCVYELLDSNPILFALDLDDIKKMYEEVNKRYSSIQSIYRKYKRENPDNEEVNNLYENATKNRNAVRFFLKKEAPIQATFFLSKAKNTTDSLYPLIHPLQKTAEELLKRGDHWFKRVNLFSTESIPENAILFIGDSITEAFYLKGYFPNVPTINRGISADFASGVVERLELLHLDSKPRAALLMIGTNNLTCTHELDSYFNDITTIIEYIKANTPKTKIYIQTILPMGIEWDARLLVKEYNAKLKELANTLEVEFLDIYSLLEKDDTLPISLSGDGIHLNGTGYEIWAKYLQSKFKEDGLI